MARRNESSRTASATSAYLPNMSLSGSRAALTLDDPAGVLQGGGKTMRHITVKRLSDLDQTEIRAYLRQARKRAGLSTAASSG